MWLSLVERYVRDVEVAGSNPVTSTRLSLDAICVPGSAISFALPLALVAGSDLVPSTSGKLPLPSRDHRFCGGRDFCCPRFYQAAVLFSRPVRRLREICRQLRTHDISRVDLVIRWGGMRRLSGFLPVQSVYADFFVVDRLWPDFQPEDFFQALEWYQKQDVTLGGRPLPAFRAAQKF